LVSLGFSFTLLTLSNSVLQTESFLRQVSMVMVVVMSLGLTGMSVGIGAILPNFKEDNPARIANGLGGTLNAFLSLGYILVSVLMLVVPIQFYTNESWERFEVWQRWAIPYIAAFVLLQVSAIVLPMFLGLRRWNRLEF
jgi:ABC-2 type transport system permease protein